MIKTILPILPLRDIVVFPNMVAPLFVGRKQSVNALNTVMSGDKKIFLLTQKNSEVDNPVEVLQMARNAGLQVRATNVITVI